jgi:hypothetical protein
MGIYGFHKKSETSIHGNHVYSKPIRRHRFSWEKQLTPDSEYLVSEDEIEMTEEILSRKERKKILDELCNKRHNPK